ncbi:hypothetical protein O0L34_g1797 [Tuta absoluta]|nr:hypothetical protein O0L34_g1797 [Tuta absoluta]
MEDDCKIEYLEEDEDIVQQCVQTVPTIVKTESIQSGSHLQNLESLPEQSIEDQIESLLVERCKTLVSKTDYKRKQDDDSDYDPSEDFEELETVRKRRKLSKKASSKAQQPKKASSKAQQPKKAPAKSQPVINKLKQPVQSQNQHQPPSNKQNLVKTYVNKLKKLPNLMIEKKTVSKVPEQTSNKVVKNNNLSERRKHNIMGFEEVMLPEPDPTRVSQISVKHIHGKELISRLRALDGLTCRFPTKR